jgi:prolyl-tRNA editing enzyme YbaK/EbsC (Cys-tRNA(Pro) deacylase)/SAM-dependent methyltransferase
MTWDEGKEEHERLADRAAADYKGYGSENSATAAYMLFEEEVISSTLGGIFPRRVAYDLGCGEGRISFLLAQHADLVMAYDLSAEMVATADRLRLANSTGNARFMQRDLELDLLSDSKDDSVDFVAASFGMGSFFERPERLLREVLRVLRPGGKAVFSYYNSESLVHRLPLPTDWNASLAARVDSNSAHGLMVTFDGVSYDISARAYSVDEVRRNCLKYFRECSTYTFPSFSAVLPQAVSGHPDALALCNELDRALSTSELHVGAYIIAVATKGGGDRPVRSAGTIGYARLLDDLARHGIAPKVLEHAPVLTMEDVFSEIDAPASNILKSVLIRRRTENDSSFVLCVVGAEQQISFKRLAAVLGTSRARLRLATQDEVVETTGFPVGALPPLGMPRSVPVIFDYSTEAIAEPAFVWCGSGKRTESFGMPLKELLRASGASVMPIAD